MDERERRIGRNEALFREVNERLEQLQESFDVGSERQEFLCECGDSTCAERIALTRAEYERVRADPTLFVVVAGHEVRDVEEVVESNERFDIVRKQAGEAERVAVELDPRSD
jgi:hypothetical protein